MLTPENARWCAVVLAAVMAIAWPLAALLNRRAQLREDRRLDRSGQPPRRRAFVDLYDVWGDDDPDPDTAYEPADRLRHDYTGGAS